MNKKQRKKLLRIAVGAVLFAGCLFLPFEGWLSLPFFFVPYIILGYDVLRKAGKGVLKGRLCDEYFLMSAATLGAFALSAFGKGECREGVAVMLFYQIGEWFQQFAMSKSRKSFTALADLRPAYARLVRMDGEQEIQNTVSPEDVPPHSVVCVRPGEKVPLDGKIIRGEGYVNTVAFTGESLPRYVKPGDTLLSGFLNEDGTLYLKTEKTFEESSASSIRDVMEKAASQKAKAETFVNRFAKVYTPSVCALALALGLLPPLFLLLRGASADFGI
ncbi:MAG: heavy metal translocating P-type ATPase, partial [Clostridia bacterium]|nr:heavy metal translocating P-type ATPase [Clostridia bacterium]